jgi:tetratricopeptide (TPR) repeat protein
MDLGESLTADSLQLSRKTGIPPAVRAWSAIFYAWNRDNNGYRSDENLRLLKFAVKECRDNKLSERETADALYTLGQDQELRGLLDDAEQSFNQALAVYAQDPLALCEQSEVYGDLAYVTEMRGNVQASLPIYQRAYDGYTKCSGAESNGALTEIDAWAGALLKLGRAKEALAMMEKAMPVWRKLLGNSPDLSEPLYYFSKAEVDTGDFVEGEKGAKELVAIQEGRVAPTDRRFGASHLIWARALVGQHRDVEALPHAVIADKLLSANALSAGAKRMGAEAHELLVGIQAREPKQAAK